MTDDARPSPVMRRSTVACGVCGTLAEAGERFCIHCGHPFPPSGPIGLHCPACHSINLLGEPFCEICGAPLPAVPYLVVTETGLRLPLPLDQSSAVLGRADALTGVFPDVDLNPFGAEMAGVSRRHARLTQRDDHYWLEDLNSVNLTYLNNQRLTPDRPAPLKDGDLVRLGRMLLTFRAG